MSIINSPSSNINLPKSLPTISENYSCISIGCSAMGNLLLALIYKVCGLATYLFSKQTFEYCSFLARNEFNLGLGQLGTYLLYGDNLIDFAYNSSKTWIPSPSDGESIEDVLQREFPNTYQPSFLDIKSDKSNISVDPARLNQRLNGCCLGVSADFIFNYLSLIKEEDDTDTAIGKIAGSYSQGASERATITQIFYSAIDPRPLLDEKYDEVIKNIDQEKAKFSEKLENKKKKIQAEIQENRASGKPIDREKLSQAIQKITEDTNKEIDESAEQTWSQYYEARDLAKNEHAQLAIEALYPLQEIGAERYECGIDESFKEEFLSNIQGDNLENGAYVIGFVNGRSSAHATALIKTETTCYLLDPNYGVFLINSPQNIGSTLWNLKSNYLNDENEKTTISFIRYELRENSI